jgi:hypothetical protein
VEESLMHKDQRLVPPHIPQHSCPTGEKNAERTEKREEIHQSLLCALCNIISLS